MPSPSSALTTLRPDLAGSLEEFNLAMDRQGFIGHRILPVLEVAEQAGVFGKIPIEQLLQTPETKRAPGGGYSRGKYKFTSDSWACEEHGHEEPLDDRQVRMYRNYLDAELVATQRALDAVLRNAEIRIATAIFNATTWTGATLTTAITNEWDDISNATPITDVDSACKKVWDLTGLWPNALILNKRVFKNLRRCDQITDTLAASGAGEPIKQASITEQMIAQCLDLDYVLVGGSGKNTAKKGQDVSLSPIWSDEYVMVARVATSNDIQEPCLGRTFHWGEDGSDVGGTIEEYRDETVRGNVIRCRHDVDEKVLYTECAHLLSNATT